MAKSEQSWLSATRIWLDARKSRGGVGVIDEREFSGEKYSLLASICYILYTNDDSAYKSSSLVCELFI